MDEQAAAWSRAAEVYEKEFIDPYADSANNRILQALDAIDSTDLTVADLGCGIGPLLPILGERFGRVIAVDFATGMLDRARTRCEGLSNIEFLQCGLTDLSDLRGQVDVACAVNSLVMRDVTVIERVLEQIRSILRPGGVFLGIVPAMDAVHYQTMLLLDRARQTGMPEEMARYNAAEHGEHRLYDFAFGDFRYLQLEQHFWHPFEIPYRLERAGFRLVRRRKVRLLWRQFACGSELQQHPPPWDWFFVAEV